jgi:site-specific recombinase XerD
MNYSFFYDISTANAERACAIRFVFVQDGLRFTVNSGVRSSHRPVGRTIPGSEPNARAKNARLNRLCYEIDEYLLRNDGRQPFMKMKADLKEIVTGKKTKTKTFADYIEEYMETKEKSGTRNLYRVTAAKVREFDGKATFGTMTTDWLSRFERYYSKTMQTNSIAIQLRNIRTVFNWAIDNGWTTCYPFRKFKIKQANAVINDISVESLRLLRDYPVEAWQEIYRDMFMLSFYLCGINVGDLLLLTKANVRNGRIVYDRQKTGRWYDIPLIPEAETIFAKYRGEGYLLNIMDGIKDYKTFTQHWNKALKKIGTKEIVSDKVGKMRKVVYHPILPNLTTYTARYTFASIGAELDIPRETIALCLGHSWTDVTSHYVHYDRKKIDEAVRKIVDFVNSDKKGLERSK